MCSIGGFVVRDAAVADLPAFADAVQRLLVNGSTRGSDAFGLTVVAPDGTSRSLRGHAMPDYADIRRILRGPTAMVLTSTRATPTTEWRAQRADRDVQPFSDEHWITTHNGTIGNDRELVADFGLHPHCDVDSAVLPGLFGVRGFAGAIAEIDGSFAIAAVDRRRPRTVLLARNFKPLVVARHASLPLTGFASMPEQLQGAANPAALDRPRVVALAPYSRATFDGERDELVATPAASLTAPRRALVVASGGLDSTVAAAEFVARGVDVTLLHFAYGCHAERSEIRALGAIGRRLGCPVRVEPMPWLGELGASSLTTSDRPIAVGETGAELPHEWVPARNMLMIAHACAIADAEGFTDIVLGTNLEEGGAYADNTQEFIDAMDRASAIGTMSRARVQAPLGTMVKHEIVRRGIELGAPLDATWSCYYSGTTPCGECGPCFMRRVAFEANGLIDPIRYVEPLRRLRPIER